MLRRKFSSYISIYPVPLRAYSLREGEASRICYVYGREENHVNVISSGARRNRASCIL